MAKYKSLFNVEGTLGEVTFYKGENGYFIRSKGGVSKNRILKDPAFARTRENLSEFGSTATSGKQLRKAIHGILADAKDSRTSSRLTQVLSKVINEDLTSVRGQRNVAIGLATAQEKSLLKGFNFNKRANLNSVLKASYTLDTATGEVSISNFIPNQQLAIPESATHVSMSCAFLNLDLSSDMADLQVSPVTNLLLNSISSTINLTPQEPATGTGQSFYFLKVTFFQDINEIQYPLNNGAYNALQLIEIL
ncbi:hypothetical protein [Yeosuana marina]|uniref:hypothetical protein n=1 Tax=Yeosuana marina TaxID=1565536 RepID=UPI001421692B|nr:hypothetical protein [Yeosuana marina]